MLRVWFAFLMFVAVSALSGTVRAEDQPAADKPAESAQSGDFKLCLEKCASKAVFCAGEVSKECGGIKECDFTPEQKQALVKFCQDCENNGASCSDQAVSVLSVVSTKPPESAKDTIVRGRQTKKLTTEQMCQLAGGVMVQRFVGIDYAKGQMTSQQECRSRESLVSVLQKLAAGKASASGTSTPGVAPGAEAEKPEPVEEKPAAASKPFVDKTWEEARPGESDSTTEGNIATLTEAQQAQAQKLADLDAKLDQFKPSFGVQFNGLGSIHILRPYGQRLFAVGGEVLFMPALTDTWRLVLGLGAGYAGQDNDEDHMAVLVPQLGLEKRLGDVFYLDFGALAELWVDGYGRMEFGSYGPMVKPQFCLGTVGLVCVNVNAALTATHFYGKKTDEVFWRPDVAFGFGLGGRFGR